ncbi:MAG: SDR family NAD(P)-dependent oxidoreductase, partial [Oscillospiraceae bacterium]|nr:SDR family NAD(P)-dependent oxidoreductase [Oscillospiraceae bacterium]
MRSVLILGGTEQISEKLAQFCASDGDTVTFVVPASYVNYHSPAAVKFLKIDRHSEDQMKSALQGQHFDVVFDCSAAAPQTLNLLLSTITTDRFIFVSSFEVYAHYCQGKNKSEADLPLNVKEYEEVVKVGSKAWYARGKYQAELLLANKYKNLNYAIVRVPFMMSLDDDYDNALGSRLLKYVEAVVRQKPVIGKRFDAEFNFAENNDTAKFLLYLAGIPFSGVVNFASEGQISMQDVIGYIEQKTGKKAIYSTEGEAFPFTVHPELTMELSRCASLLYTPLQLKDWLYQKLDNYIAFTSPVQRQPRIEKSKVQNWLVTGGSTGVGRTMVLRLMQLGYTVAATSRDVSKLNELPDSVVKIQLDVTNPASCRQAVQTAIEKMGRVDVLVNNAGLSHTSSFEETPDEVGNAIIETNYWGVSNMMKAIIPY